MKKKILTIIICILISISIIGCKKETAEFIFDKCVVISLSVGATEEFNKKYDLDIQSSSITLCSHEWSNGNDTIVFEGGHVLDDINLIESFCYIDERNKQFSQGEHKNSFICEE